VFSVNKNMVVVHTDHKPLVDSFVYENVPAIIEGWLPGIYGGNVLASCVTGSVNPSGKLPVDIPHSVGQQPVYFYQYRGSRSDDSKAVHSRGYRDISPSSRFPFGYGLSYTTFSYSDGALTTAIDTDGVPLITVSITVTNSGGVKGDEVVQLYGIDEIATITRPQKELVGFKRVSLESGKARKVSFTFRLDQFAFINAKKKWVIEKGLFCFYIGKGSREKVYEVKYSQEQTLYINYKKRGFFADVELA
jgi:beta-glucosidase